jgi:hypothetical protein
MKIVKEEMNFERGDPKKSLGIGKIHLDHFESVIITALEGGSNYWYMIRNEDYIPQLSPKNPQKPALSERIAYALYTDPKFKLPVYDIENPKDFLGTVTQGSMYRAFELVEKNYLNVYIHIMEEQYDVTDADIIFQLATMGKLVFG